MRYQSILLCTIILGLFISDSASAAPCVRLSVSEVTYGEQTVTDTARDKLREFATDTLKQRGWSGKGKLRPGREKMSCETYVDVGPLGLIYQCRLTATYCVRQRKKKIKAKTTANNAIGKTVRLRLRGSTFEVLGVLKKFDASAYVIAPPDSDDVTVPANRFYCVGKVCPKSVNQVPR